MQAEAASSCGAALGVRAMHSLKCRKEGWPADQQARNKPMNSHAPEMSPSITKNNGLSVLIMYFMTGGHMK